VAAIATVLGDNDVLLRRHAVESLGRTDNDNAVQLLGQALLGDRDPSVRLCAVHSFANQNSEVARAFLNTALQDKDAQEQALARQALGYK
jgi:HEAT repeat protein